MSLRCERRRLFDQLQVLIQSKCFCWTIMQGHRRQTGREPQRQQWHIVLRQSLRLQRRGKIFSQKQQALRLQGRQKCASERIHNKNCNSKPPSPGHNHATSNPHMCLMIDMSHLHTVRIVIVIITRAAPHMDFSCLSLEGGRSCSKAVVRTLFSTATVKQELVAP